MRCFIGVDLGSTTTKAVVLDENSEVLGRGITNSRSNYDVAAEVAKQEALVNTRFHLFRRALQSVAPLEGRLDGFLVQLDLDFRLEQFLEQRPGGRTDGRSFPAHLLLDLRCRLCGGTVLAFGGGTVGEQHRGRR